MAEKETKPQRRMEKKITESDIERWAIKNLSKIEAGLRIVLQKILKKQTGEVAIQWCHSKMR